MSLKWALIVLNGGAVHTAVLIVLSAVHTGTDYWYQYCAVQTGTDYTVHTVHTGADQPTMGHRCAMVEHQMGGSTCSYSYYI